MLSKTLYREEHGLFFHLNTPEPVREALAKAWAADLRVRIWLGDANTGRAWREENDVIGYVGRSCGRIKVPLLIHNKRSASGCPILDHCIVRIDMVHGGTLYKHEAFDDGTKGLKFRYCDDGEYRSEVIDSNGVVVARFPKPDGASNWVQFLKGRRYAK